MSLFSLGQSRHLNWGSKGKQDHLAAHAENGDQATWLVSGWGTPLHYAGKTSWLLVKITIYTYEFLMCFKEVVWQFRMIRKDELTGTSVACVADIQAD